MEGETPTKRQKLSDSDDSKPLAKRTRPDKPDFEPLYKEHRKVMETHGLDTDMMIKVRRAIHSEPEGGFKEFKTQEKIL